MACGRKGIPMKRLIISLLAVLCLGLTIHAQETTSVDQNLGEMLPDMMRVVQDKDHQILMMWFPEEYWVASMQKAKTSPAQQEQLLAILHPYVLVGVVDGMVGPLGGFSAHEEPETRAQIAFVGVNGKQYKPLEEEMVPPDLRNLVEMMKPVMAGVAGPMGRAMRFYVFNARGEDGKLLAAAKAKGKMAILLHGQTIEYRLPLDSVLPPRKCGACGERGKGSWEYCPWCGTKLPSKSAVDR